MENLYWFTNYDGENILNDFYGTEKEAVKHAEKQAKILGEDIYVNCNEDIIDVAFAQDITGGRIIPTALCNASGFKRITGNFMPFSFSLAPTPSLGSAKLHLHPG